MARRHGTFDDCIGELPAIKAMGFDVLYLPPIHPIGRTRRKGRNNTLTAAPGDPGSPWAIGAADGGHRAIHAELGTLDDFKRLLAAARALDIEVALDIAFQSSPDHPYVAEHPAWFRHRPDGSVQFAENPPKKYQDIYPFDFESADAAALWRELLDVVVYWVDQGVRTFRVDNPHTKPLRFWEWLIAEVRRAHPDVVFLAEAFTRPKIMHALAKLGFSQSYTYFAWRNSRAELIEYFEELAHDRSREYFRPNVWPNTPDILTAALATGERATFIVRLVLAATLSANYGIYGPAYELMEHAPSGVGEEYAHSEKYEIRAWARDRRDSLRPLIARINAARHEHPALQQDWTLRFCATDNEFLLCYAKTAPGGDAIVTVVNLDPRNVQSRLRHAGPRGARPRCRCRLRRARPDGHGHLSLARCAQLRQARSRRRAGARVSRACGAARGGSGDRAMKLDQEALLQRASAQAQTLLREPLWFKDAVIYQLHVKAFRDSNGDGIGDFKGLTESLGYIKDLGVNTLWLLPFYPSPQRDDGYDIADYHNVHASHGTKADFRRFIREAHHLGLRVITELVINHTSDQHPWFQAARRAPPGSVKRDYYVWSDDASKWSDTRIIFTDTETSNWAWDDMAKAFYWHRFFAHQPDLNFANPHVIQAVVRVMHYWFEMGVDGMRLDAIPYLCERDGTNNENLPETHAVLKYMRAALDRRYPDRFFLAEVNQWPEDVREYFGNGDECHMAYHFPLMPRMYMAVASEDRQPIIDIMAQTPEIPDNCQWAVFLRNHDELTLEMVTERERTYMYDTYARDRRMRINVGIRRRLAPLMDNDRRRIELLNSLLMSILGSPVIYYGDEIGMGDNVYLGDRNGVRTPMQWSPDRNGGFSRADPQTLYASPVMDPVYGYQSVNVEAQARSTSSLLAWMKRLIAVRKSHAALSRGTLRVRAARQPQDPRLHPRTRRRSAAVRRQPGALEPARRARPPGIQGPHAGRAAR